MFDVTVCSAKGEALRRFDLSRLLETGARAVIGRAEDCDIRIKSPAISRHHCVIEIDDGDWIVRDMGSSRGTFVEGVQISEAAVVAGLEVVIGPAVLRFALAPTTVTSIGAELRRERRRVWNRHRA